MFGNLRSEGAYVNGKAHGIQLQYYKSGIIFKRKNFDSRERKWLAAIMEREWEALK